MVTALPDLVLEAVSARTEEGARAAAEVFGSRRWFGDSIAMVQDPDVAVVAVTFKVPEHRDVVLAALAAGKHVSCEWPLGRDLAEAREMAAAVPAGTRVAVGLQGVVAPALERASSLVRDGAIGRPLVLRAFGTSAPWGPTTLPHYAYLQQKGTGAGFEAIGVGHVLPAVEALAGDDEERDARASTRYPRCRARGDAGVRHAQLP